MVSPCRAFGVSETCYRYSPLLSDENELIADLLVGLDAGAIDQQVQRALRAAIGDVDCEGLLVARQGPKIRYCPVQLDHSQQVFDEARRLPKRHPE